MWALFLHYENESLRVQDERENIALRVKEKVKMAQENLKSESRGCGRPKTEVIPGVEDIVRRWNLRKIMEKEALEKLK